MMKLTLEYIQERHRFWKEEIAMAGIWNASLFQDVKLIIRKNHRNYNALFQRAYVRRSNVRHREDRIIIYNKTEEFEEKYLNSLIVHEMIHQYLLQSGKTGIRPHGKEFKELMNQINETFPDRLEIKIRSNNPSLPSQGEGDTLHHILLLWTSQLCYCCVINPSKLEFFQRKVARDKKKGLILDYEWKVSTDYYFRQFSRCTKVLSGKSMPHDEVEDYCKVYHVRKI